ncbi:MAG: sigma-70 family RNA polymerase sigma factor [Pseudobutyrivibrio sp.]|nr:sigma-70 family RNA polymerase sigma factor [Pseudobutyrivibrio sp.]
MENIDKDQHNRNLCSLIRNNDLLAETQLLMENEALIVGLAGSMEVAYDLDLNHWGGIEKDDIIQEGRIALLRAAQTYDESNNTKFSTYAYTIVKNAMTDLCRKGISAFENRIIESGMSLVFLDEDYSNNEFDVHITETVPSAEFDPTARLAVLHVMLEKMYNRLKLLPARQRRLLAYHYGLGSLECKSISETAAYFHLTEKYIKIIEEQALATLREGMNDGKIV